MFFHISTCQFPVFMGCATGYYHCFSHIRFFVLPWWPFLQGYCFPKPIIIQDRYLNFPPYVWSCLLAYWISVSPTFHFPVVLPTPCCSVVNFNIYQSFSSYGLSSSYWDSPSDIFSSCYWSFPSLILYTIYTPYISPSLTRLFFQCFYNNFYFYEGLGFYGNPYTWLPSFLLPWYFGNILFVPFLWFILLVSW